MTQLALFELTKLQDCEAIIEAGLQTFVEVGEALAAIRDDRLYRDSHPTFEDYCRERWGMSRDFAYKQIRASNVYNCLQNNVDQGIYLPQTESQARPLTSLEPEQQRQAWQEAVATAPNGKITAAHVESVVEQFNYKRDAKSTRPVDIYTPQGYDACQTPAYAIDPLLEYIEPDLIIWEPAAGEQNLVEAFYDCEHLVTFSDILTGQNFFEYEPDKWDCIITNPPYSIKYQWLARCYELGKPFALLLPVETLGSKTAQELFEQYGVEIILLDKRINFKMPNKGWDGGGSQFPVAWFTWGFGIGKTISFGRITR